MRIHNLLIENFKGAEKITIPANGANVLISGENGTGKSTIADAYNWIFTGKFFDGGLGEVNAFDANGKILRDTKIHAVEIELEDKKIRRELVNNFDKRGNFKSTEQKFYVDGVLLKQKDFDAEILKITNGAALNPFNFCTAAWKERRNILLRMCKIDDAEILKNFPDLKLENLSAENFISAKKLR